MRLHDELLERRSPKIVYCIAEMQLVSAGSCGDWGSGGSKRNGDEAIRRMAGGA
jgi:hypothetical protein